MGDENLDDHKKIMRRIFYELLNYNTVELIEEFFAINVTAYSNSLRIFGMAELKSELQNRHEKFPERHFEILTIIAEANIVCVNWNSVLKHDAFEKPVSLNGICVCHFDNGKITKIYTQWDEVRLLKAMGLLDQNTSAYQSDWN